MENTVKIIVNNSEGEEGVTLTFDEGVNIDFESIKQAVIDIVGETPIREERH